ncbi:MAG TPA: hypothetical protein VD995_20435 [Azospirillum sp.]|nr:hypothetical protein [Azospirillum sp.]
MSREELIDLLEQGLDQGLSSDELRRALTALVARGDAAEILAAVHRLAGASADLRAACDAAPPPAGLEAGILQALAVETAARRSAAASPGLLDRLPGLLAAVKARSADVVRSVGQTLSPDGLAAVTAARGPMAAPEPAHGAPPPAEDAHGGTTEPTPPPSSAGRGDAGPMHAPAAIQAVTAQNGVVHLGPGTGTRIVGEDAGPVTVDLGPLGPLAMGGWILHLERGAVAEEHDDRLRLTDGAEGLIVLPDGSVLAFGPVAEIRWDHSCG